MIEKLKVTGTKKQLNANEIPVIKTKKEFGALIEKYALKNPIKFANKKSELEKKLNSL